MIPIVALVKNSLSVKINKVGENEKGRKREAYVEDTTDCDGRSDE